MSTCACRQRRPHCSSASARATLEEANALDVDHLLLKTVDLFEKADAVRERYSRTLPLHELPRSAARRYAGPATSPVGAR
ncbi:MAG: hypothetical protein HW416_3882 [Chloroflexi bacterium]|nr:hypothetical protein [Chloroflexota bacterium]